MSAESLGALAILAGFLLVLAVAALWLWALIDALTATDEMWQRADGLPKALVVVLMVVAPLLGGPLGMLVADVVYFATVRPRLRPRQR